MTQDPYGQPQGSGYVVRGEVVPDDEANVTPPDEPMTRFQKVASALRGERTDPAVPVVPAGPDPNGTWPGADQAAATTIPNVVVSEDVRPEDTAAADDAGAKDAGAEDVSAEDVSAEDVGAARSPDGGNRDHRDDEGETHPEDAGDAADQDPTMTQPDLYGTTAPVDPNAASAGAAGAGAAGAGAAGAGAAAAGTAAAGTAGAGAAAVGAAEPETVGKHAGAPVQEGLQPGETGGLADFSDLTYRNLLPDAAEFKTRWHQVQFRFVDDPQGSVTEAADVITQVTAELEAAIQERQRAISERQRALRDRWSDGKSADTESLRETLLMYRAFLDQLTGPKMS